MGLSWEAHEEALGWGHVLYFRGFEVTQLYAFNKAH